MRARIRLGAHHQTLQAAARIEGDSFMALPTFIAKSTDFQVTLETQGKPLLNELRQVVGFTEGKRIRFRNGLYKPVSEQEAEQLRAAATYGSEFYEVGQQPGAESPSLAEQMEAVAVLSAKQDAGKLREVLERELETYSREPVVNAAQRALGALGDLEMGKRPAGRPRTAKEIVG